MKKLIFIVGAFMLFGFVANAEPSQVNLSKNEYSEQQKNLTNYLLGGE